MPTTTRSGSSALLVGVVVRVAVSVAAGVLVAVGSAALVAVGEGVGTGVAEGVGVLVGDGVFLEACEAVGDGVPVGLRVGVGAGVGDGVRVGVRAEVAGGVAVRSDTGEVVVGCWVGEAPVSAVVSDCGVPGSSSPVPLQLAAKAQRTTAAARAGR